MIVRRSELGVEYVEDPPTIIRTDEEFYAHYTVRTRKDYRELNYFLYLRKDASILDAVEEKYGHKRSLCVDASDVGLSLERIMESTVRVEYAHSYGFAGRQMKGFLEGHGCEDVYHLITIDGVGLRKRLEACGILQRLPANDVGPFLEALILSSRKSLSYSEAFSALVCKIRK